MRQLSVAPGYAPATGVLSESDWMLTKQGKKTTYHQGNDRSIQKALVTSLREYESKFEQCDCEGVEDLLIRIAEEILLLD